VREWTSRDSICIIHLANADHEGVWGFRFRLLTPIAEVELSVVLVRERPPPQDQAEAGLFCGCETAIARDASAELGDLGGDKANIREGSSLTWGRRGRVWG